MVMNKREHSMKRCLDCGICPCKPFYDPNLTIEEFEEIINGSLPLEEGESELNYTPHVGPAEMIPFEVLILDLKNEGVKKEFIEIVENWKKKYDQELIDYYISNY